MSDRAERSAKRREREQKAMKAIVIAAARRVVDMWESPHCPDSVINLVFMRHTALVQPIAELAAALTNMDRAKEIDRA